MFGVDFVLEFSCSSLELFCLIVLFCNKNKLYKFLLKVMPFFPLPPEKGGGGGDAFQILSLDGCTV